MFSLSDFNGDLSGWDTSSLMNIGYMFRESAFDGDLSAWNVSKVRYAAFTFSHLSTPNYDALLIGWSTQPLINDVDFDAGTSQYSAAAAAARAVLAHSWTITDGGPAP